MLFRLLVVSIFGFVLSAGCSDDDGDGSKDKKEEIKISSVEDYCQELFDIILSCQDEVEEEVCSSAPSNSVCYIYIKDDAEKTCPAALENTGLTINQLEADINAMNDESCSSIAKLVAPFIELNTSKAASVTSNLPGLFFVGREIM